MRERTPQQTPPHDPHRAPINRAPRTRLPALLGAAAVAGAGLAFAAGPALADCAADIGEFDAALIAGEAGTTAGGDMPATEHQEQVLSGSGTTGSTATDNAGDAAQADKGDAPPMETAAGDPTGDVEAISPHQRDVIRALNENQVDGATRDTLAVVISEARAALQNGDEAACEAKMDAAREIVRGG